MAKHRFLAETSKENKLDFIALLEMGRDNFTSHFLETVFGGLDYDSHCLPPRGSTGGILLGFNCKSPRVLNIIMGDYAIKFHVRSKVDGFRRPLVVVNGAA